METIGIPAGMEVHTDYHSDIGAITEDQGYNHQQIIPPEASFCDEPRDKSHYDEHSW